MITAIDEFSEILFNNPQKLCWIRRKSTSLQNSQDEVTDSNLTSTISKKEVEIIVKKP